MTLKKNGQNDVYHHGENTGYQKSGAEPFCQGIHCLHRPIQGAQLESSQNHPESAENAENRKLRTVIHKKGRTGQSHHRKGCIGKDRNYLHHRRLAEGISEKGRCHAKKSSCCHQQDEDNIFRVE